MNAKQIKALGLRETDLDGAIDRCCNNEQLYETLLKMFLTEETMDELSRAVEKCDWDGAFTSAHALKGLAGNMGFVPLMHSTGQLVVLIRGGRISEVGEALDNVESCYRDITDAIRQYFDFADKCTE